MPLLDRSFFYLQVFSHSIFFKPHHTLNLLYLLHSFLHLILYLTCRGYLSNILKMLSQGTPTFILPLTCISFQQEYCIKSKSTSDTSYSQPSYHSFLLLHHIYRSQPIKHESSDSLHTAKQQYVDVSNTRFFTQKISIVNLYNFSNYSLNHKLKFLHKK